MVVITKAATASPIPMHKEERTGTTNLLATPMDNKEALHTISLLMEGSNNLKAAMAMVALMVRPLARLQDMVSSLNLLHGTISDV